MDRYRDMADSGCDVMQAIGCGPPCGGPVQAEPRRSAACRASRLPEILLACAGAFGLAACGGGGQKAAAPPPVAVGVITAQPAAVPLDKELVGRLSAYRSADVRARVAGVLLKRTYEEGSNVKQGQQLFQIDPAPLKAALDAAQAALAQAQAQATNARVNAQRARELAPKGYISKADLDNAEANARTTAAAVQAARANVETARINLGFASVASPINGRAGQQQVTEGALVGNNTATLLTTVDQIDPLYVNFTISVSELNQLRQAQHGGDLQLSQPGKATVKVALPDGTPYPEPGTIDFSATAVDPATGSVRMRALLPNPGHLLLPGSFVNITAKLGERKGVFLVPQAAVQRDAAGSYVLIAGRDGKVERRGITTVGIADNDWIVTAGIATGDQVIVSGIQLAPPGTPVKPEPWQPAAAASATAPARADGTAPASSG